MMKHIRDRKNPGLGLCGVTAAASEIEEGAPVCPTCYAAKVHLLSSEFDQLLGDAERRLNWVLGFAEARAGQRDNPERAAWEAIIDVLVMGREEEHEEVEDA